MSQINLTDLWSKFTSYFTKQMHKFILLHFLILNFTCVCDVYLCMCMYTCMSVNVIKWMLKSAYGTLCVSPYLPPCLRQWPFAWTQYSKLSRPRASRYSYPHLLSHRWTTRITDSHYRTSFMWTPEFQLRFLSLHLQVLCRLSHLPRSTLRSL